MNLSEINPTELLPLFCGMVVKKYIDLISKEDNSYFEVTKQEVINCIECSQDEYMKKWAYEHQNVKILFELIDKKIKERNKRTKSVIYAFHKTGKSIEDIFKIMVNQEFCTTNGEPFTNVSQVKHFIGN